MFIWKQENIQWYQAAAAYNSFHKELCSAILPYVEPSMHVYDIGCGLGYIDLELAPLVKHITALDINNDVLACLKAECEKRKIENISILNRDWAAWGAKVKCDVLILSYYGVLEKEWNKLKNLTNRYIISILPESNDRNGFNIKKYVNIAKANRKRETLVSVALFLQNNDIPYELIKIEAEFGQPLSSREEAEQFIMYYYKLSGDLGRQFLNERLIQKGDIYYLPNKKKIGILVVDIKLMNK